MRLISGLMFSLLFAPVVLAGPVVWQAANGDTLQLIRLEGGAYWASLTLSDQHTANFADNELILLQIDSRQPVSLVHGLRSCGAPARAPQQIGYQFGQDDDDWLLRSRQPPPPLPDGFVIRERIYTEIASDRRAYIVDFPLQNDASPLWPQWQSAKTVSIHYSLDNGTPVTVQFDLSRQHELLAQ